LATVIGHTILLVGGTGCGYYACTRHVSYGMFLILNRLWILCMHGHGMFLMQ